MESKAIHLTFDSIHSCKKVKAHTHNLEQTQGCISLSKQIPVLFFHAY
jgi:hypothetical protein